MPRLSKGDRGCAIGMLESGLNQTDVAQFRGAPNDHSEGYGFVLTPEGHLMIVPDQVNVEQRPHFMIATFDVHIHVSVFNLPP